MSTEEATSAPPPWHAAYPAPKKSAASIDRQEVLELLRLDQSKAGKNFVLVDLRRNDHEGGTIRGSINLPAQSLNPTIPTLYSLFKEAGLEKVIWYCSSSRGRGTRAAGWLGDYIESQGDDKMRSLVLVEGLKGWATAGPEYVQLMEEYDEKVWAGKSES